MPKMSDWDDEWMDEYGEFVGEAMVWATEEWEEYCSAENSMDRIDALLDLMGTLIFLLAMEKKADLGDGYGGWVYAQYRRGRTMDPNFRDAIRASVVAGSANDVRSNAIEALRDKRERRLNRLKSYS